MKTATYVIDYAAKGQPGVQPRRLHRLDCPHFYPGTPTRPATPLERQALPTCFDCAINAWR